MQNLQRKAAQADVMFSRLITYMNDALHLARRAEYTEKEELPTWLSTIN